MSPRRLAPCVSLSGLTLCALGLVASPGLQAARGGEPGPGVESGYPRHEAAHAHPGHEVPDGGGGAAPDPTGAPVPTVSNEGRAFLEENARRPGVVVLPSGLQYRVLEAGSGPQPGPRDTVTVHYRATTTAGTEFDSTYAQGGPVTRRVDQFAPGWAEGLQLMREGARWELFIPPALGFGERSVLRDRVLVVTMDLLSVAPAPPARAEPAGQGAGAP